MTEQLFEELIKSDVTSILETLTIKGKEYRRNQNPFHNFDKGVEITGKSREDVIWGFALKHFISIQDIKEDLKKGIIPKIAVVDEKYNDLLIYLMIEKNSIKDQILNAQK